MSEVLKLIAPMIEEEVVCERKHIKDENVLLLKKREKHWLKELINSTLLSGDAKEHLKMLVGSDLDGDSTDDGDNDGYDSDDDCSDNNDSDDDCSDNNDSDDYDTQNDAAANDDDRGQVDDDGSEVHGSDNDDSNGENDVDSVEVICDDDNDDDDDDDDEDDCYGDGTSGEIPAYIDLDESSCDSADCWENSPTGTPFFDHLSD